MGYQIFDIYKKIETKLKNIGVSAPKFESFIIIKYIFNKNYVDITDKDIKKEKINLLRNVVKRRQQGEPLQYILKEWDFWGLKFKVGQGVLIPRSDTEILVEEGLKILKNKNKPVVIDLCSGSGCIAISIAKERADAKVYAVEKMQKAYQYLKENVKINNIKNIYPVLSDIFDNSCQCLKSGEFYDLIISNPPYIKSGDISQLQKEIQYEPLEALDGGDDGLYFYKNIIKKWVNKLKINGVMAFEIGKGQDELVYNIMKQNRLIDLKLKKDLNKINRVIYGKRDF